MSLLLVPTGGKGTMRQIDLTTARLRWLVLCSVVVVGLCVVGVLGLLGWQPNQTAMDTLRGELNALDQTVLALEREVHALQVEQHQLQSVIDGQGPIDAAEMDALFPVDRPADASPRAVHHRALDLLGHVRWQRSMLAHQIEAETERRERTPSIWPTQGYLTSGFGMRISPIDQRWVFHQGLDIGAPLGTPVVATAAGVVRRANYSPSYGFVIDIEHREGLMTRYGHNTVLLVEQGDAVLRGDVIALVGSTGRSTGPHLHYEVHVEGETVDPFGYIHD